MNDGISVIMCCYKGDTASAIKEAVNSILKQTIKYLEFVIVVDGPVSEEISEYLGDLEKSDNRIRVLRLEKNYGAAFARNYGMANSVGNYIAIMDADDIAVLDRLERQMEAIQSEKADAVWA